MFHFGAWRLLCGRPLSVFEWIWATFPLVLLFLGGAIGGGLGAAAAVTNVNLIRDESKGVVRYVLCALVTVGAFLTWLLIVSLLRGALRR